MFTMSLGMNIGLKSPVYTGGNYYTGIFRPIRVFRKSDSFCARDRTLSQLPSRRVYNTRYFNQIEDETVRFTVGTCLE